MRRAGFHAGRTGVAVIAKIAFVGFGFLRTYAQPHAAVAHYRTDHHLHRAVRAGDHAGFAANAALLHDVHKAFLAFNRPVRADVRARCVFALATDGGGGNIHAFDDVDTRQEGVRGKRRAVLLRLMGNHARHFTGTATNTLTRIGHNKTVHLLLQHYSYARRYS
ncbi:hypothetical protein L1887_46702 [Cichorium endivia]|nr:hypothetical protein L1887_46702 [Cichorium endivia]